MGFVPDDFEVPELLEHERFRVRPLTVHDVVEDYDAEVWLYRRWMLELWNGDLLRVRDGRFAEYRVSSDGLQLMAQLGALGPGP